MSKWTMIYDECYQEIIQEIKKTRRGEIYTKGIFEKTGNVTKNNKLL